MNCHPTTKDCLDYLIAIAPIIISLAVAWFAWVQASTNKSKLRLDLYNRRFAVYEKTINYYLAYMSSESQQPKLKENADEFVKAVRESRFLFGKDSSVHKTLIEIQQALGVLVHFYEECRSNPDSDLGKAYSRQVETLPNLENLMVRLEDELSSRLDFHKVENP